jgi:hypothetical protein
MLLTSCNVRNDKPYFAAVIGFNQAHRSDHKMALLLDINKPYLHMQNENEIRVSSCTPLCSPVSYADETENPLQL